MRRLVVLVGLPRSGKTTWARQQGQPIVNPDSIRYALHGQRFFGPAEPFVWAMAYAMTDALFRAGHDTVIVDATHTTHKRRELWRGIASASNAEYGLHVVATPPEECMGRARSLDDEEIVPVIERMAREWDLLGCDGFPAHGGAA
jgi:predicted kinase